MAEGGNLPETDLNYAEVHSIKQSIKKGCITITFFEQIRSEHDKAHIPSWKKYMCDEVLQNAMKLVERGRADSEAKCTTWTDSGITSGLLFTLDIKGVEVSDDDKKKYTRRMRQYLKKMSKTVPVEVQTARDESSRLGGQKSSKVPTPNRNSRELRIVPSAVLCEKLFQSDLVVFVSQDLLLEQDNSVIRLYEGNGQIPFAFTPTIRIPLNCFRKSAIPVFLPQRSFLPYVEYFSLHMLRCGLKWMIATPDLRGCETGLIPFLIDSVAHWSNDSVAHWSNEKRFAGKPVHPWCNRVRINPPVDNQRDLLASPRIQERNAEPSEGSASNAPSFGPRLVNSHDFPPLPPGRTEEVNDAPWAEGSASNAPSFSPRIVNSHDDFPPLPPGRTEEVNDAPWAESSARNAPSFGPRIVNSHDFLPLPPGHTEEVNYVPWSEGSDSNAASFGPRIVNSHYFPPLPPGRTEEVNDAPWAECSASNAPSFGPRIVNSHDFPPLSAGRTEEVNYAPWAEGSASNAPSFGPRIVNSHDFPPLPPGRTEEVNDGLNMDMSALSLDTLETSNLVHQLRTLVKDTFQEPSTDNNNNEKQ